MPDLYRTGVRAPGGEAVVSRATGVSYTEKGGGDCRCTLLAADTSNWTIMKGCRVGGSARNAWTFSDD
ncbi:hypothetical protein [Bosea sp. BIWAKO-01]|uniref:hypothetical protein n=1 Tax=Bosea sp. BIWAKO-01 TaxID=506668 RepID=UPI00114CCB22|nr:hypothetical protein [Bosea sp. BIWAKO-01]